MSATFAGRPQLQRRVTYRRNTIRASGRSGCAVGGRVCIVTGSVVPGRVALGIATPARESIGSCCESGPRDMEGRVSGLYAWPPRGSAAAAKKPHPQKSCPEAPAALVETRHRSAPREWRRHWRCGCAMSTAPVTTSFLLLLVRHLLLLALLLAWHLLLL